MGWQRKRGWEDGAAQSGECTCRTPPHTPSKGPRPFGISPPQPHARLRPLFCTKWKTSATVSRVFSSLQDASPWFLSSRALRSLRASLPCRNGEGFKAGQNGLPMQRWCKVERRPPCAGQRGACSCEQCKAQSRHIYGGPYCPCPIAMLYSTYRKQSQRGNGNA